MRITLGGCKSLFNDTTASVITVNTVKAYTRTLYRKLDVNSRSQAVARARALGMLS